MNRSGKEGSVTAGAKSRVALVKTQRAGCVWSREHMGFTEAGPDGRGSRDKKEYETPLGRLRR